MSSIFSPTKDKKHMSKKLRTTKGSKKLPIRRNISETLRFPYNSLSKGKWIGQEMDTIVEKCGYFPESSRRHARTAVDSRIYSVYPDWLLSRVDFIQAYKSFQEELEKELDRIVKLHFNQRSEHDKQVLFNWVSSVKFFSELPENIIRDACDKLLYQKYQQGETILKAGDSAHSMLIIYTGQVGIFVDNEQVDLQGPRSTLGECSLRVNMPQRATCIAESAVQTFQFKKNDFENILLNIKKLEKQMNSAFIQKIPYFADWTLLKIQRLSTLLVLKEYSEGEVVFEKDDQSEFLYILKEGKIEVQTNVEVIQENRWPTGLKQWKVREIHRKYLMTLANLKSGDLLGYAELVGNDKYQIRALAATHCTCLLLNRQDFYEVFSGKDINRLLDSNKLVVPTQAELEERIIREIDTRNSTEKALLDAMKIDLSPYGRINRDSKKMEMWANSLQLRRTQSRQMIRKKIVHENKRFRDIKHS